MMLTERLVLRAWRDEDRAPFAAMSADPAVMRTLRGTLTRAESDAYADRAQRLIDENGFGFWVTALRETGAFLGVVGLHRKAADSGIPRAPLIEVGWRLARPAWGHGYATEAARAAVRFGFTTLDQPWLYAFTAVENAASIAVMRRIGMHDLGLDFDHPAIPAGAPLARHCLYGIARDGAGGPAGRVA